MNVFDIALAAAALVFAIVGLVKGLARIAIGLASLVVAFLLAAHLEGRVAAWFIAAHVSETPARFSAYLVIFVATMVAGGAVAWLVGRILKLAMLSWADRLAGAALGLLGALVAAALVAHPIVAAAPGGSRLLNGSRLAPYVTVVADLANALAPRDLAERYTEGIGALRRAWRGQTGPQAQPPRARGRD